MFTALPNCLYLNLSFLVYPNRPITSNWTADDIAILGENALFLDLQELGQKVERVEILRGLRFVFAETEAFRRLAGVKEVIFQVLLTVSGP